MLTNECVRDVFFSDKAPYSENVCHGMAKRNLSTNLLIKVVNSAFPNPQYGEPSDWEDLADVKAGVKGDDDGAGDAGVVVAEDGDGEGDEEKEDGDANLPGQVDQDGEGVEKDEADDGDNGDGDEGDGNNDQPNPEDEIADDDM